jgi:glycerol-3-phosphate O-acyltransferase
VVVDKEGFARIREISKSMPFVVIPCHRSHIDYLLLSYVFEKNNIPLPFVAAGTNLMFWPLGYIFRKSGAFFIRRSFKGDDLYGIVFSKYLKMLLKEGLPVEFFIEGGRSRTGKMVMPRYGLLSMVIQAYQEGISSDLAILPVFIGYDRVIEEKSYLRELGGAPKKKENAGTVIRNSSILRKRYGRVYVNAGEPIQLKSYLSSLEKHFEQMSIDERRSFYRKLGYEIVAEINKVSVVTPFSLIAACLLCSFQRGISHDDLTLILNLFYDFLQFRNVPLASTFAHREKAISDALLIFESEGLISKMGIEEEDKAEEVAEIIYSVEEGKRLNLEYYKNNVLHFFIPLSFIATSILAQKEDSVALFRIIEDYKFLKRLFRNEFIFEDKKDDLEEVNSILTYMLEQKMIKDIDLEGETCIEIRGRGRTRLRPFAGLIHNYMESYWVVIRSCSYLKKEPKTEREFLRKIQQLGTRMYKKGEVSRAESLSSSNYTNALKFLADSDILLLSLTRDKKEREIRTYYLAEDKRALDSLRQRVFRFL